MIVNFSPAEGTLNLCYTGEKETYSHTKFLRNGYANGKKALAYFAYKLCLHTWNEEKHEAARSFTPLLL